MPEKITPTETGNPTATKLPRRDVLRIGVAGTAITLLGNEAEKGITGRFETNSATYFPLYETHALAVALDPRRLPGQLDFHFAEGPNAGENLNSTFTDFYIGGLDRNKQNLNLLSDLGTSIIALDTRFPKSDQYWQEMSDKLRPPGRGEWHPERNVYAYSYLFMRTKYGLILKAWEKLLRDPSKPPEKMSRRKAFINTTIGGADLAAGYLVANSSVAAIWNREGPDGGTDVPVIKAAAQRVAERLYGLASHAKPFDHQVFFRNLIWAYKLSDFSEKMSRRAGRKVNISYQVGDGHSGMEDLITLGEEFCYLLLSNYPKEAWLSMLEDPDNFGVNGIASTALLKSSKPDGKWEVSDILKDDQLVNLIQSRLRPQVKPSAD